MVECVLAHEKTGSPRRKVFIKFSRSLPDYIPGRRYCVFGMGMHEEWVWVLISGKEGYISLFIHSQTREF